MDDRGLAALAGALTPWFAEQKAGIIGTFSQGSPRWDDRTPENRESWMPGAAEDAEYGAAAILGERGVFLPEGDCGHGPAEIEEILRQNGRAIDTVQRLDAADAELARLRAGREADTIEIIRLQHEWANANGDAMREADEAHATIARLRDALRVASHKPHDQDGEPDEGFPVCSVCGAIQTEATIARLRDALEGMVRQFAYWSDSAGGIYTGGLSALEEAFDVLGWDEPYPLPDRRCDEPGCMKDQMMGWPTRPGGTTVNDGYRRTCWDHRPGAGCAG